MRHALCSFEPATIIRGRVITMLVRSGTSAGSRKTRLVTLTLSLYRRRTCHKILRPVVGFPPNIQLWCGWCGAEALGFLCRTRNYFVHSRQLVSPPRRCFRPFLVGFQGSHPIPCLCCLSNTGSTLAYINTGGRRGNLSVLDWAWKEREVGIMLHQFQLPCQVRQM